MRTGLPAVAVAVAVAFVLTLAGCGQKGDYSSSAASPSGAAKSGRSAARKFLAYEHALRLEVAEPEVAKTFESVVAACRDAAEEDACTVLESHVDTGRSASASVKLRARPAGVQRLIQHLARQGEVVSQSSTAQDLAGPIQDGEKKLAMLNDYRAKLEALRGRAGGDIDALIKVNKELAQVQGELEDLAGQQAHLMQRVDTEILGVSIQAGRQRSFWRPMGRALADFGENLSQGVSVFITGLAYLLPWLLALPLLAGLVRWFWRRWRRNRPVG